MSMKTFLQKATEEQIQQLGQCESAEAVIALAKSFDVTPTTEETQKLKEAYQEKPTGELDEAELDQVAGGTRTLGSNFSDFSVRLFDGSEIPDSMSQLLRR